MPKFTITNVLNDVTDEAHVTKMCYKDAFLNSEINNYTTFLMIKSWTSKKHTGTLNFTNVMIKCSPQIRKHIMKCMMVMFTWDYQGVKVLITSLYHSAIIAINSTISLVKAQIGICQVPVANVLDGRKLRTVNVTFWRSA